MQTIALHCILCYGSFYSALLALRTFYLLYFSLINAACVPLPQPGAPNNMIFNIVFYDLLKPNRRQNYKNLKKKELLHAILLHKKAQNEFFSVTLETLLPII